jgi:hypothetical protein
LEVFFITKLNRQSKDTDLLEVWGLEAREIGWGAAISITRRMQVVGDRVSTTFKAVGT